MWLSNMSTLHDYPLHLNEFPKVWFRMDSSLAETAKISNGVLGELASHDTLLQQNGPIDTESSHAVLQPTSSQAALRSHGLFALM